MPLPLFLGIGAAVAGLAGVGAGISGGVKMKEANDTMKLAEARHNANIERFEKTNTETTKVMDRLGKTELETLNSFQKFTKVWSEIHNPPEFASIKISEVSLPEYSPEELEKASVGAEVILSGLKGAAAGTAGGFAAAGATTSAVMALGTASTGTAISTLSGAAATKATLAAIGGGAIKAGGLGIAGGTAILGVAAAGAAVLVGGIIFNINGTKLSEKADEAYRQMKSAEAKIDKTCKYLTSLKNCANGYYSSLAQVKKIYDKHMTQLCDIVYKEKKTDWLDFSDEEKIVAENTVLLVSLLFNMCKVQIVKKDTDNDELNELNYKEVGEAKKTAKNVLEQLKPVA